MMTIAQQVEALWKARLWLGGLEDDSEYERNIKLPEETPDIVLHFFFKNGNPKTDSLLAMMATLIDQWMQQYRTPQFVNLLIEAMQKSNSQQCRSLDQLWAL